MKNFINKKENGGYAILFTVAVVGIISMITIGLSNAAYKQMILSSVAKDSTTAFYQSDLASECALYADDTDFYLNPSGTAFTCAGYSLNYTAADMGSGITKYTLNPTDLTSSDKCFNIVITKTETTSAIATVVESKGYNICNTNNIRTVERAVKVTY